MRFYSPKTIELKNKNRLHCYFANNRGRGKNNVTYYLVGPGVTRTGNCRSQGKNPFISVGRTSGWRGLVNIPSKIINDNNGLIDQHLQRR